MYWLQVMFCTEEQEESDSLGPFFRQKKEIVICTTLLKNILNFFQQIQSSRLDH